MCLIKWMCICKNKFKYDWWNFFLSLIEEIGYDLFLKWVCLCLIGVCKDGCLLLMIKYNINVKELDRLYDDFGIFIIN